jgi:glutaredoxin/uncharacterized protein (DUF302 family)
MNLAYFRKSKYSLDETFKNLYQEASKSGLLVLGRTQLPSGKGTVLNICNSTWMENLIASDASLIGLLPCSIVVLEKDGEVKVGVGSPAILGSITKNPAIGEIAAKAEKTLKNLINSASGVGPLKPTSIKLYATMTCPYCKMEAAWLDSKKINFEEIHVDLNEKAAQEMVEKTGQMGVPVTAIEYEDGEEEFIIGFDRPHLEEVLNVK